jgi:hypothetical protein
VPVPLAIVENLQVCPAAVHGWERGKLRGGR